MIFLNKFNYNFMDNYDDYVDVADEDERSIQKKKEEELVVCAPRCCSSLLLTCVIQGMYIVKGSLPM